MAVSADQIIIGRESAGWDSYKKSLTQPALVWYIERAYGSRLFFCA